METYTKKIMGFVCEFDETTQAEVERLTSMGYIVDRIEEREGLGRQIDLDSHFLEERMGLQGIVRERRIIERDGTLLAVVRIDVNPDNPMVLQIRTRRVR